MKIYKKDLQEALNNFEGEYREIFIEKSKSVRLNCLNGVVRVPSFGSLDGLSILSRNWKKEYFKIFDASHTLQTAIEAMKKEFSLFGVPKTLTLLAWEEYLELDEIENISFDITSILQDTQTLFQKMIASKSWITSSDLSLILSKKSFVVGNSQGKFVQDTCFYNTFFVVLIGEKNGKREEMYKKIAWNDILEEISFENIEKLLETSILELEKQLDGNVGPNGKIDVIIWNEAGGTIIHEAVWHGLEADLQNSSVYRGKIWQKVASQLVSVVDNPTLLRHRGHYKHDHEGNVSQNTVLIENGILKSYLHNEKTAEKFWVNSTWHGRKETYKHKTLVRMWNTYLLPGNDTKEELISRVKNGLYVSAMWGGQVDTTSWDFVFKVQSGFLIEDGKLTTRVNGATLSGNGPEMLNEIYGICNDLEYFDHGTCGKWQSMPVSDATPTILTKLKVSSC